MGFADMWLAYECLGCPAARCAGGREANSGVVFDVRVEASDDFVLPLDGPPVQVGCPLCGRPCQVRATWEADPNGYGSRAETMRERAAGLVRAAYKPWDGRRDAEGEPGKDWCEGLAERIEALPILPEPQAEAPAGAASG